jgi:hypothetical protein
MALAADEVPGPDRRCLGASDDELTGLLRTWATIESWAAGAKLGVVAEMIRRDPHPRRSGCHGDLPDERSPSLRHELALALACSVQSAETTAWLAWEQQARLPCLQTRRWPRWRPSMRGRKNARTLAHSVMPAWTRFGRASSNHQVGKSLS